MDGTLTFGREPNVAWDGGICFYARGEVLIAGQTVTGSSSLNAHYAMLAPVFTNTWQRKAPGEVNAR